MSLIEGDFKVQTKYINLYVEDPNINISKNNIMTAVTNNISENIMTDKVD